MTLRGGHTLQGPGVHVRTPLWAQLPCGCCARTFTGNAHSVPAFFGRATCASCWARLNLLRRQAGLDEWDTPDDAYPEGD